MSPRLLYIAFAAILLSACSHSPQYNAFFGLGVDDIPADVAFDKKACSDPTGTYEALADGILSSPNEPLTSLDKKHLFNLFTRCDVLKNPAFNEAWLEKELKNYHDLAVSENSIKASEMGVEINRLYHTLQ